MADKDKQKDNREDARYEMLIGGCVLLQDGKVVAVGGAPAAYRDLKLRHVQALWKAQAAPELLGPYGQFMAALTTVLYKVGNAFGLAQGSLTAEDIATIEKVVADATR